MKVTTLGGGSTYTPELAQGFLAGHAKLGPLEWTLMDIDPERLDVVGGFVQRMVAREGNPFPVRLKTDRMAAMEGADFVITQIRVGGMASRHEDEVLGRRWGLIGQETTGVGGMACALRTVPVVLSIARQMQKSCPDAWLINFTNPSGLLVEALQRHVPQIRSVGLCNGPIGYQMMMAEELGLASPFDIHLDYLGLNHLAWIRGARVRDEDVWARVFGGEDPAQSGSVMERLGVMWNPYLNYYYDTRSILEEQAKGVSSRAEQVMTIEKRLLARYADTSQDTVPPELMERGGAYYSTAAVQLIEAMALDLGQEHIVNTRHSGRVEGIPSDWVMELPCRVSKDRIEPLPANPLPSFAEGLLRSVKACELLTIEAACKGDRNAALAALIAHPLGPDVDQALEVLEDILNTNRDHLMQFF